MNITLPKTGFVTLENYWGEHLKRVYLSHTGFLTKVRTHLDMPDGTIYKDALIFQYQLGIGSPKDYWYMEIETLSGKKYRTKDNFYCSISEEDHGQVTIGMNGEEKTMYVNFPSSSDCKTNLNLY
ncbi:hypothetical protein [Providencia rustigianii]|uniref:hypothetical protein n=1 Tax=Providencia rustigianii TaxID=158850 RepID=UPI0038B29CF5